MRAHALASIRSHDAQRDIRDIAHAVDVGMIHRAGVEGGDLVVIEIGDDEGLRGVGAVHGAHPLAPDTQLGESLGIDAIVSADCRHHYRLPAQRFQVVCNIARAAAPFATHLADLEGNRKDVRLVGKDVTRKTVREDHDGVECERATDQSARSGHRLRTFAFVVPANAGTQWRAGEDAGFPLSRE